MRSLCALGLLALFFMMPCKVSYGDFTQMPHARSGDYDGPSQPQFGLDNEKKSPLFAEKKGWSRDPARHPTQRSDQSDELSVQIQKEKHWILGNLHKIVALYRGPNPEDLISVYPKPIPRTIYAGGTVKNEDVLSKVLVAFHDDARGRDVVVGDQTGNQAFWDFVQARYALLRQTDVLRNHKSILYGENPFAVKIRFEYVYELFEPLMRFQEAEAEKYNAYVEDEKQWILAHIQETAQKKGLAFTDVCSTPIQKKICKGKSVEGHGDIIRNVLDIFHGVPKFKECGVLDAKGLQAFYQFLSDSRLATLTRRMKNEPDPLTAEEQEEIVQFFNILNKLDMRRSSENVQ